MGTVRLKRLRQKDTEKNEKRPAGSVLALDGPPAARQRERLTRRCACTSWVQRFRLVLGLDRSQSSVDRDPDRPARLSSHGKTAHDFSPRFLGGR